MQLLESRITTASLDQPVRNEAGAWLVELRAGVVQSAIDGKLFNHFTAWDLDWLNPSPDLYPHGYHRIRRKALWYISQLDYVSEEDCTIDMLGLRSSPVRGLEGADYENESIVNGIQAIEHETIESKRSVACTLVSRDSGTREALGALILMLNSPDVRIPEIGLFGLGRGRL